ncbi:MAG: DUF6526 family protein [Bacteroidia bacterium]
MKEQNFSNHRRYIPSYHFFFLTVIIITMIASLINLYLAITKGEYALISLIIFLLSLSALFGFFFMRIFALKAQNRAIRAEENLRYFVLTGKLFPHELKMSQIVALRFAPDEEFTELVQTALKNNLSNIEIKKAIKKWKADHHRA